MNKKRLLGAMAAIGLLTVLALYTNMAGRDSVPVEGGGISPTIKPPSNLNQCNFGSATIIERADRPSSDIGNRIPLDLKITFDGKVFYGYQSATNTPTFGPGVVVGYRQFNLNGNPRPPFETFYTGLEAKFSSKTTAQRWIAEGPLAGQYLRVFKRSSNTNNTSLITIRGGSGSGGPYDPAENIQFGSGQLVDQDPIAVSILPDGQVYILAKSVVNGNTMAWLYYRPNLPVVNGQRNIVPVDAMPVNSDLRDAQLVSDGATKNYIIYSERDSQNPQSFNLQSISFTGESDTIVNFANRNGLSASRLVEAPFGKTLWISSQATNELSPYEHRSFTGAILDSVSGALSPLAPVDWFNPYFTIRDVEFLENSMTDYYEVVSVQPLNTSEAKFSSVRLVQNGVANELHQFLASDFEIYDIELIGQDIFLLGTALETNGLRNVQLRKVTCSSNVAKEEQITPVNDTK